MKLSHSRRILSAILAFVMVIGLLPAVTLLASAQNVTGSMYASGIWANEGIVLYGDTTLNMDTDLTVAYIKGDYALEIQSDGEHTLTVDNPNGSAINVKTLKSVKPSQGTVNLTIKGGDDYFAIATTGDISLDGIKLDAKGGAGIRSEEGNVTINGTSVSVVGNDGVGVIANSGSISIDSDYLFVQCAGQSGDAWWEHGIGATKDVTITSDDATIAGIIGIQSDEGNITLNGNIAVGGTETAVYAVQGTITMTGAVTAQGGDDYHAIGAKGNISFNGTKLDVKGGAGIRSTDGNVTINGTNVSVVGSDGIGVVANSGSISIDSDYLFVQCAGQSGDAYWEHGIGAVRDITIISNDATIAGSRGIQSDKGNIVLNGNIAVGGQESAVLASEGTITMTGAVTAQSGDGYFAIGANGDISFEGSTLTANGYSGICGKNVDILADSVVITTDVGSTIKGDEVYVTANYLWAENKSTKSYGLDQYGISATNKLALNVKGGTVLGYDDALHVYDGQEKFDHHYIYVSGSLTAVSKTGAGMYVPEGIAESYGGPIVSVGETHGIYANYVYFDGSSLRVDGNTGIYAASDVELSGEDIQITAFGERNSGIWCENGYVDLLGEVVIETNGWYGVNVGGDLSFGEGYYKISGPENNAQAVLVGGNLTLDGTLEIVEPKYGHVNGNDIYGAGDSPAMEVLIRSQINDVSLYIDTPKQGTLPNRNPLGIYFLDPRCVVDDIVWFENGVKMSEDAKFAAGRNYSVKITITADGSYYFADDTVGKINGKAVSSSVNNGNKEIVLTCDFGQCSSLISALKLTIDAPRQNSFPDQSVTCGNSTYKQAPAGVNMFDAPLQWQESINGQTWTTLDYNDTFTVGYYYRVYIDIMPANGYEFALDPQLDPDVTAVVNGYQASVSRYPEADPSKLISVCYDFGQLNDNIIEQIDIDGVAEPVVGEKPSYNCAISGTGYTVNTAYDNGTYAVGGISWYDVTYDMWVRPNDTFRIGHQYKVFVDVKTENGYEFYTAKIGSSYRPEGWGYINDNYATFGVQSDARFEQSLSWTFTCQPKTVKAISVTGLEVPVDGFTPDFDAITDSEYYTVESIQWTDYTNGTDMTQGDTFIGGNEYWVLIDVVPKEEEGNRLCQFVSDKTVAFLNGAQVKKTGSWQEVVASKNHVRIFYVFPKAESDPVYFLSGYVSSSGYEGSDVTVQLIPKGLAEPTYETVLTGNAASYYFADVPEGTYTLKVTKLYHDVYTEVITVNNNTIRNVALVKNGPVFADVSESSWQHPFAAYACERGLMAGKGTDGKGRIKFDPNKPISREEFVQVLYNAEGKPVVTIDNPFPDVKNDWYKNAVLWANQAGIASGMGNGNFGVGKNISRQDLAMMLYKYAKMKGCSLAADAGKINQFADGNKVADYAKTAMDWAVTNGILSGKGETGKPLSTFHLDPTGTATRAECAAMLKNFMSAFGL